MTAPGGAATPATPGGGVPVHPIEAASMAIVAERADLGRFEPGARVVVARMVHASADTSFAETARVGERAVAAGVAALRAGAPVVTDAVMVAAGARRLAPVCLLDEPATETLAAEAGTTRAAAAMRRAAERYPSGAVWLIGNAPTALEELLRLAHAGVLKPAVVVGLPVGFVGAAEAKQALWDSPLAPVSITNAGERGGSAVAAAAANALWRLAQEPAEPADATGDAASGGAGR